MAYTVANSGIYKITAPSGAVYIGQSRNIKQRFNIYFSASCPNQRKLYNALKKYSFKNCSTEIVHHLDENAPQGLYDFFEILFIDTYKFEGNNMLNIREGGSGGGKMSDETKKIISDHHKLHPNKSVYKKGHRFSKEVLQKLSDAKKGKPSGRKGLKFSEEAVKNIQAGNKAKVGRYIRGKSQHAKKVINTATDVVYDTLMDAAEAFSMKRTTLGMQLSGHNNHQTTLRWYKNV